MITVYRGKNSRQLVAIGPDMGITVSSDNNGMGLLEGTEAAMEDIAKAIMAAQEVSSQETISVPTGRYPYFREEKIASSDHISAATKMIPAELNEMIQLNLELKEQIRKNDKDILPAAQPALHEEKPPQSEEATTRNSRMVENLQKVPLTTEQKNTILEMHAKNIHHSEIKRALNIDGRRVVGVIRGQEQRERMAAMAATGSTHPNSAPDPSLPGVEGAPEAARAHPRGTPEEGRQAPKSISRADLNIRIWNAHQAGDSIAKISEDLNLDGFYYDERQVRNRLSQQGAKL
jgi:hypothetical protein